MNTRIVKALCLAPLSVLPVTVIPTLLVDAGLALAIGMAAVVVAYAGMLVIGIPVISLLGYLRATRWWQLVLAGAIGGASAPWVGGEDLTSLFTAFAGAFGALVAGVAWFIAFRRPPNGDLSPTEREPTCRME